MDALARNVLRIITTMSVIFVLALGGAEVMAGSSIAGSSSLCTLSGPGACDDAGCRAVGPSSCEGGTSVCEAYIDMDFNWACACNTTCMH